MKLKIDLCKQCKLDFEKSEESKKFDINKVSIHNCEMCNRRIESVTNRYNTEEIEMKLTDDDCATGT